MHAETHAAGDWWAKSRGAGAASWVQDYQGSVKRHDRTALVEILKGLEVSTLLEVGCHCGPTLVRFAQELPDLKMIGVDVNTEAITAGRAWVAAQGLSSRIQLNAGRVPEMTASVPTGSCDVVLSCYALAYIAPADLDAVLYEMGRIASKAVILAEPMTFDGAVAKGEQRLSGYREWIHDYVSAGKWIGTWHGRTANVVPLEPPVDRMNAILVVSTP